MDFSAFPSLFPCLLSCHWMTVRRVWLCSLTLPHISYSYISFLVLYYLPYLQSLVSNLCISLLTVVSSLCLPVICVCLCLSVSVLWLHVVCLVLCSNLAVILLSPLFFLSLFQKVNKKTNSPPLQVQQGSLCVCLYVCFVNNETVASWAPKWNMFVLHLSFPLYI